MEFAAIGPSPARHRGRADAAGVDADIADCVGDASAGHAERASAGEADVEIAAVGPGAARHRGRADASGVVGDTAKCVSDASAGHAERAGAGEADAEFAAIGPSPARHRGRADAAEVAADRADCVGDASAGNGERAGAAVTDIEIDAIGQRAAGEGERSHVTAILGNVGVRVTRIRTERRRAAVDDEINGVGVRAEQPARGGEEQHHRPHATPGPCPRSRSQQRRKHPRDRPSWRSKKKPISRPTSPPKKWRILNLRPDHFCNALKMEMRDTALSTARSKRCAGSGKESLLRLKQLKKRLRIKGHSSSQKTLAPRCCRKN